MTNEQLLHRIELIMIDLADNKPVRAWVKLDTLEKDLIDDAKVQQANTRK